MQAGALLAVVDGQQEAPDLQELMETWRAGLRSLEGPAEVALASHAGRRGHSTLSLTVIG